MEAIRHPRAALALAAAAACALAPARAEAESVTIEPVKDNTLYETATGTLSNGSGDWLFVGQDRMGDERRAVLAFDVAAAVPPGSTIESASLAVFVDRSIVGDVPVSLHRLLADWGEGASNATAQEGKGAQAAPGDATWLHAFFDGTLWGAPGGDFDPSPAAATPFGLFGPAAFGPTDAMRADVQSWLDEPGSNHGWILVAEDRPPPTAKRIIARENPFAPARPLLTITFDPPFVMETFEPLAATATFEAPGADRFGAVVRYELAAESDGLDAENETVAVTFGTYEETLPPGSFACGLEGCLYESEGPGLTRVAIGPHAMALSASGVDLGGTSNPVAIGVRIGNDVGGAEARLPGTLQLRPDRRGRHGAGAADRLQRTNGMSARRSGG